MFIGRNAMIGRQHAESTRSDQTNGFIQKLTQVMTFLYITSAFTSSLRVSASEAKRFPSHLLLIWYSLGIAFGTDCGLKVKSSQSKRYCRVTFFNQVVVFISLIVSAIADQLVRVARARRRSMMVLSQIVCPVSLKSQRQATCGATVHSHLPDLLRKPCVGAPLFL